MRFIPRSPGRAKSTRVVRARSILAAAVAALALGLAPAAAQAANGTDSRQASFSGSVFDQATNEIVDLAGQMHVVTKLSGSAVDGWTVDLHANLHDTVGTGRSSGACYVATGADTGTAQMPPGLPNRAVFQTSFALHPPNPSDQGNFEQQGNNQGNFEHPPDPCHNQVAHPPGPCHNQVEHPPNPCKTALPLSLTVVYNADGSVASVQVQLSSST